LSPDPATPHANRLWADLVIEELVRDGVDFFCVAPGSRSTPLVAALAANPRAKSLVHFDERGTAFAAMGHARATARPPTASPPWSRLRPTACPWSC
jgi:2-succinyl-5-enolpyruvyl-6-hydroxy-3-cyclohexene-1-carboxylate synthase